MLVMWSCKSVNESAKTFSSLLNLSKWGGGWNGESRITQTKSLRMKETNRQVVRQARCGTSKRWIKKSAGWILDAVRNSHWGQKYKSKTIKNDHREETIKRQSQI